MNKEKENIGELALIRAIRKRFPTRRKEIFKGIGDDAMVLKNGIVISTDSFFESVHFNLEYFSFSALGYHCLAASMSDLAAMAAQPLCALISLNLSNKIVMQNIEELYNGFEKLSRKYRFDISGGDVVSSPCFGLTITVIGQAHKALLRSTAEPGHMLFVTNFLGLAEVGRSVLRDKMPQKMYPDAINKHLFPEPRISEAQSIKQYARSCIDTSDGLSTDAFHLAEESKVKIIIDAEHVPIHPEVGEYCSTKNIDPLHFILSSGEDFELLFTAFRVPKIPGATIFRIGRVLKGMGLFLSTRGKERPLEPTGYEHLR